MTKCLQQKHITDWYQGFYECVVTNTEVLLRTDGRFDWYIITAPLFVTLGIFGEEKIKKIKN